MTDIVVAKRNYIVFADRKRQRYTRNIFIFGTGPTPLAASLQLSVVKVNCLAMLRFNFEKSTLSYRKIKTTDTYF